MEEASDSKNEDEEEGENENSAKIERECLTVNLSYLEEQLQKIKNEVSNENAEMYQKLEKTLFSLNEAISKSISR